MPKVPTKETTRIRNLAKEYAFERLTEEGGQLLCLACITPLSTKKSSILQHLASKKHKDNKERSAVQQTLQKSAGQSVFHADLCKAFVSVDIHLFKLTNPVLKNFLEKYTGRKLPTHSTIRNKYLDEAYCETLNSIRRQIGNGPIWVSVDEATDADGRFVAHVIIGKLIPDEALPSYLLHTDVIERTNNETIAKVFTDALSLLWTSGILYDQVLLLVTDAAGYMTKAGEVLGFLYTRMVHVTCAAHGLHRVCEVIRSEYALSNCFINAVKKVFKKAPTRVQLFKDTNPNIPLPPSPVTTRWGTWLSAAAYHAKNLNAVVDVVMKLNKEDSEAVAAAQEIVKFKKAQLIEELTKVTSNYTIFIRSIANLQTKGLPLVDSLKIISGVTAAILNAPDKKVKDKLAYVLKKNVGLQVLSVVAATNVAKLSEYKQFKNITPELLASFKFAPIVSADVERSFSLYKIFLADNRRRFTFENIRKHLVIQMNTFDDE